MLAQIVWIESSATELQRDRFIARKCLLGAALVAGPGGPFFARGYEGQAGVGGGAKTSWFFDWL
jgi:hypothetical protein